LWQARSSQFSCLKTQFKAGFAQFNLGISYWKCFAIAVLARHDRSIVHEQTDLPAGGAA
jgi:hypothetical protein